MKEDNIIKERIGSTAIVDDLDGNEVKGTIIYARKAEYNFNEMLEKMNNFHKDHNR